MAKRIGRRDFIIAGMGGLAGVAGGFRLRPLGEDAEKTKMAAELSLAQGQLAAKTGEIVLKDGQHAAELARLQAAHAAEVLQLKAEVAKAQLLWQVEHTLAAPLVSGAIDVVAVTVERVLREGHRVERDAMAGIRSSIGLVQRSIEAFFDVADSPIRILGEAVDQLEKMLEGYVELTDRVKTLRDEITSRLGPVTDPISRATDFAAQHDPTQLIPRLVTFFQQTQAFIDTVPRQLQAAVLGITGPVKTYLLSPDTGLKARIFVPLEQTVFQPVLAYFDRRVAAMDSFEQRQLPDIDAVVQARDEARRRLQAYHDNWQKALGDYIHQKVVADGRTPTVEELLEMIKGYNRDPS